MLIVLARVRRCWDALWISSAVVWMESVELVNSFGVDRVEFLDHRFDIGFFGQIRRDIAPSEGGIWSVVTQDDDWSGIGRFVDSLDDLRARNLWHVAVEYQDVDRVVEFVESDLAV